MSEKSANDDRVLTLAAAVCDATATAEELAELETTLRADAVSRKRYLKYCRMHVTLQAEVRARATLRKMQKREDLDSAALAPWEADALAAAGPAAMPQIAPVTASFQGPTGYLADWPLAYLVATVICGIGLSIGAFTYVTRQDGVGGNSPQWTAGGGTDARQRAEVVGQITGEVDCEYEGTGGRVQGSGEANPKSEIRNRKSEIHLGDRLALRSGLLEITYNTGARVILEGPVTYKVETPAGGYLAVGKLSVKLEQRSEVSGQRSGSANQKSEIRNQKSFTVRTPTAVITDLGTEFGVAVDKQGETTSYVFRGSVHVAAVDADGTLEKTGQVLRQSESAHITRSGGRHVTLLRTPADPSVFVREIPTPRITTLNLVDVVAGGDRASGRRSAGVNPTSGERIRTFAADRLSGDGQYHPVAAVTFVDGVFIPNGRHGPVQTDSAGHFFALPPTANRTIGGIWAFDGPVILSPPSAPSDLPAKASEQFAYRYEMSVDPTTQKFNGGVLPDWTAIGSGSYHLGDGVLTISDGKHLSATGIWPVSGATFAGGYTVEMRVKVVADTGMCPVFCLASDRNTANANAVLAIGARRQSWDMNPADTDLADPGPVDNADGFHVFRLVQEPGARSFRVWRDGVLLGSSLGSLYDDTLDRLIVGGISAGCTGATMIDYVRFTPGAYAPAGSSAPGNAAHAGSVGTFPTVLGGVDYASPRHRGLFMHANKAITFDLEAIRRANPNCRQIRFRSVVGNTETLSANGAAVSADVWVLVDGQPRFRRREINGFSGAMPVNILLGGNDRFLTLVATDGGNGIQGDWIMFGDPRIEWTPARDQHPGKVKTKD